MERTELEKPFAIKILDADFNLVSIISYKDLQWDREFNTVGKFVIDGILGQYDRNTWVYVYSEKRKELGIISQVNYKKNTNDTGGLTLSGLFAECELNKMVCYTKPTKFDDATGTHYGTSILSTGSPTWVTSEGTADVVARAFFDGFKQISFRNYLVGDFDGNSLVTKTFTLPIEFGTVANGDYHISIHNRNNEYLGDKLYDILKESKASIEVVFDYENKTKTLNIIHGIDRTQDGHEFGVNPVLLSTKNGTIQSVSLVTSNTDTKDVVMQYSESDEQTLVLVNALEDSVGRFIVEDMSSSQSDFINDETPASATQDKKHKLSVMGDASKLLAEKKDILNLEFDFDKSSYRYMEDFDLGDIISLEIPEIGISADAQIIACHEVVKNGVWSLGIEIGTTTLRKRGNV